MEGLIYKNSNDSVQLSFKHKSHENLAVDTVATVSNPIPGREIIISLAVAAHVKVGAGLATVADFILPAGVWPMLISPNSTVSVIKLTGSDSGQASIIIPEG